MEKLQAALDKARQKRGDGAEFRTDPAPAADAPAPQTRGARSAGALWTALPEMQLDPAHLKKMMVLSLNPTPQAAQFDILRTKLVTLMRRHNWKRVAITSPTPSCGKTTVAANLITGFARQKQIRGMLFDLDLRRPALAKLFGARPEHCITEFLDGAVPFEQQAMRIGETTALSIARRKIADATAYLASERTAKYLDDIERRYAPDLMLFDLPPLLVGDDARAFLKNVDCALLIARAGDTTAAQIDKCETEIAEQSNMAGVVLNQCRYVEAHEKYGYYDYGGS